PAAWSDATVRAAILFPHNHATAVGIVSTTAVRLAGGLLNTMYLKTLGMAATSLLILGGFAAGGGLWAQQLAARTLPAAGPPTPVAPGIPPEPGTPEPRRADPDPVAVQPKADRPKDAARELALDDGHMTGRKSIAGGGHAVRFEAPDQGEGWMLTAVRIH